MDILFFFLDVFRAYSRDPFPAKIVAGIFRPHCGDDRRIDIERPPKEFRNEKHAIQVVAIFRLSRRAQKFDDSSTRNPR